MALDFHSNTAQRILLQSEISKQSIVPFIAVYKALNNETRVLEIGCGEGGVLKPFLDLGCQCTGVDLAEGKNKLGHEFLAKEIQSGQVQFIIQNVLEESFKKRFDQYFDVVILKDTIEHVYDQHLFIPELKHFLKPDGVLYFGFPPWAMPYGGHQQLAKSKWINRMPWIHLLPRKIYNSILKLFGEDHNSLRVLNEIVDTRISLSRFHSIIKKSGFTTLSETLYLIAPAYQYKFGLKPIKQLPLLRSIPWLRDICTTTVYILLQKK